MFLGGYSRSLCSVPLLRVQKGPAPAGVNPSQYTSTTGAINRLGDKTKGSFLKMEDTAGPVCRSGNFKGKAGIQGHFKAVGLAGGVGLGEGNAVTQKIFSLFRFTKAGCCFSFQIKPTYIYDDGWLLGREVCISCLLAAEQWSCVEPDSPFCEPLPGSTDAHLFK